METPFKAKTALEKSAPTREQPSASNSALSARSRRRSSGALATLVAGALLSTVASGSAQAAPKPHLNYVPGELLVKYKINPRSQTASRINAFARARAVQTFDFMQTQHVKIPSDMTLNQAMAIYLGQSKVESVQPNYWYVPLKTPNDPLYTNMYGLPKVSAPEAWDLQTGDPNYDPSIPPAGKKGTINKQEIVVAVIDTGVNINHADLTPNIWRNRGEIPGNGRDDDKNGYIDDVFGIDALDGDSFPNDDVGHGTHVAGTIGAVGDNNLGVTGVNWRIKIMPLRFLSADGGPTSGAITCMEYMLRMKKKGVNIRVANHSWGPLLAPEAGSTFDPLLRKAFADTEKAGILNVVAAGNGDENGNGQNNDALASFPANLDLPGILTVAASDQNDNPAGFTNYGLTTVDLAAPGVRILSTYIQNGEDPGAGNLVGTGVNSTYAYLDGTSMATPHVAGAAALVAGFRPFLSVQQLHDTILNSVDKLPQWQGLTVSGGRLNIRAALQAAAAVPPKSKNDKKKYPFPFPFPNPNPTATMTGTGTATATATETGTATATATATATPLPEPLVNGQILYTEQPKGSALNIRTVSGTSLIFTSRNNFNPSQSYLTGKLAFTANLATIFPEGNRDRNEIYVSDADGSNQLRLTNDDQLAQLPVDDREPAISPDGRFIVFASLQSNNGQTTNGRYRLFVIPTELQENGLVPVKVLFLDGTSVSGTPNDLRNPTFNQGGTKIAFQSNAGRDETGAATFDVYTIGFDPATGTAKPSSLVRITNNPADDRDPTFGPAIPLTNPNEQLAFASNRVDEGGQKDYDIYRLADASTAETPGRASSNPAIPVTGFFGGRLSGVPDRLIFIPGDEDAADGNSLTFSTFDSGDELHPSFSPDGTQIAFTSNLVIDNSGITDDPKTTNPNNDFDIYTITRDSRTFNRVIDNKPVRTRNADATGYTDFFAATDGEPFWATTPPESGGDNGSASNGSGSTRSGNSQNVYGTYSRAPITYSSGVVTRSGMTTRVNLQSEGAEQLVIMRNPENGVLRGEGAERTYTPIPGFVGTDEFTYVARNEAGQSEEATVKIQVGPAPALRAAIADTAANVSEQSVTVTFANALDAASAANAMRYSVFVNGKPTDIENGQFSSIDNSLTLTLPQGTLHQGDKVIVQWEKLRNFEGKALLDGKAQFTVR